MPELGGRVGGVAADDEHVRDAGLPAAGHDVGQVRAVADLLRGQVRRHGVPVADQPRGQVDGRVLAGE